MTGQTQELTEYQIAVDVLGRRKDVELGEDASVRNRAYELRQRLERYYTAEHPDAPIRIEIPRGGYVPAYTRHAVDVAKAAPATLPQPQVQQEVQAVPGRRWKLAAISVGCVVAGLLVGFVLAPSPHPPSILKEAWGPLAESPDELPIVIATNMHMLVRPHIREYPGRIPAPNSVYSVYGPNRPLPQGTPLYMEPAQLSVPIGEVSAATTMANLRSAFGGTYQILPEAEAPVAALRGRNGVVLGSGTNSQAATTLLRNMPFTIDYNADDQFAVFDRRKPPGQDQLFVSQPVGNPVPSVVYGLLSVITTSDLSGNPKRTVVVSGSASAGVQAAVEFFCSPAHMRDMKNRFLAAGAKTFPPIYQVVVRCTSSGVRLLNYEYAAHAIGDRP